MNIKVLATDSNTIGKNNRTPTGSRYKKKRLEINVQMDRLDKFSALVIGLLLIWAIALIAIRTNNPDGGETISNRKRQVVQYNNSELEKKIDLARNLLLSNHNKAEEFISSLIAEFPYSAMSYFLRGDLYLYSQQPIQAMHAYRQAVDLNIDFLDKKTPLYQGKKIRNTVNEAEQIIDAALSKQTADPEMIKYKKEVYYMKRRIAGSCGN